MKPNRPLGIDAIMARMPRRFVEQARKAAERARRLRAAQAAHFRAPAEELPPASEQDESAWQDTVIIVCDPRGQNSAGT